ncbi:MAG: hypothetical protein ABI282_06215 [Candidatus Baltobacteraceae bacterium]
MSSGHQVHLYTDDVTDEVNLFADGVLVAATFGSPQPNWRVAAQPSVKSGG